MKTVAEFFGAIWSVDKFLSKTPLLEESHPDREARASGVTCRLICLILLLMVIAGGLAWRYWG